MLKLKFIISFANIPCSIPRCLKDGGVWAWGWARYGTFSPLSLLFLSWLIWFIGQLGQNSTNRFEPNPSYTYVGPTRWVFVLFIREFNCELYLVTESKKLPKDWRQSLAAGDIPLVLRIKGKYTCGEMVMSHLVLEHLKGDYFVLQELVFFKKFFLYYLHFP